MAAVACVWAMCWAIVISSVSASRRSRSYDIGSICQTLWNADTNSLRYNQDFRVNLQNQVSYGNHYDMARKKLFARVDETKLTGPTFTAFKALLDNYDRETGHTETKSSAEMAEDNRFLKAVMATKTMKALHKYLVSKRLAPVKESSFKHDLKVTWFYFYRRQAYRDSSGFEHVFLGELSTKNWFTEVTGFHNWLQFYLEEKKNNLANYYGFYAVKKSKAPAAIKLKMSWHYYPKSVTTFLLGTSPEFEMALYTACFKLRPNQKCTCSINGQRITVQTHSIATKYIGSAYVVI